MPHKGIVIIKTRSRYLPSALEKDGGRRRLIRIRRAELIVRAAFRDSVDSLFDYHGGARSVM
jgi:hypothetical protein